MITRIINEALQQARNRVAAENKWFTVWATYTDSVDDFAGGALYHVKPTTEPAPVEAYMIVTFKPNGVKAVCKN